MADKLQQGVSVLTTFVDGETPTAAKLNSITAQLRNAAKLLEAAVGDVHDQSYPYSSATAARLSLAYGRTSDSNALTSAETRRLDIANVARLIGPASNLNPELLPGDMTPTEGVPTGVYEFSLQYPPESTVGLVFTKTAVGEPFQTLRASKADLDAAGDYFVDAEGRVFTTLITDAVSPGTVTYTVNADSFHGGPSYLGSRFNVMPDPNQLSAGGSGCTVGAADAQGRRAITLPTVTHQQMNATRSAVALGTADPNYNSALTLPLAITEAYSVGEVLPSGFLLLKNWTTGESYDLAEYTYNGPTSVLIGLVDITVEVDRGDSFVIVTVGTDLTTSVDDLRRKSRHAHDRSFGEPLVPAAAIGDWTAGPWGARGSFTASEIDSNYAPQYLHRYGYSSGENDWNDQNAMRGHLLMGRSNQSPGNYVDVNGTSYSIYWGSLAGPRLYNVSDTLNGTSGGWDLVATDSSFSIKSEGGDLILTSTSDDILVKGGLRLDLLAGDPYVTADHINDAGMFNNAAGNMDFGYSAVGSDSLITGPMASYYTTSLSLWAIDENGSTSSSSDGTGTKHYATTQNNGAEVGNAGWKVPAFQVLHYAQQDLDFAAFDNTDSDGGGSGVTYTNTVCWAATITLPTYLFDQFADEMGAHAIIGYTVMVKSFHTGETWHSLGGAARLGQGTIDPFKIGGERVSSNLIGDASSAAGNKIKIMIAANGNTEQHFHKTRWMTSRGDSVGDVAADVGIDVKVTLLVAAPTNSVVGLRSVL